MQNLGLRGLLVLLCVSVFAAACKKDTTDSEENTGVSKQSWKAENWSLAAGESLLYSFVAGGTWSAESNSPAWCKVLTPSGSSGITMLRVATEPNTTGAERTATISVRVTGFSVLARVKITQSAKDGDYTEVNGWVDRYMRDNYLWNGALGAVTSNLSLNYSAFLSSLLHGVAAQTDEQGRPLNRDDGRWTDGSRQYFYSYISGPTLLSSAETLHTPTTRADESVTDTGLWRVRTVKFTNADKTATIYGFAVYGVVPATSADKAGLQRGMFITQVDGTTVTGSNYLTLQERLYRGTNVTLQANHVVWNQAGAYESLTPLAPMTITATTYRDPSIYKTDVAELSGKKIAYMLYMGFETADDAALIAAFADFKSKGAEELILDLRSNGGGAVRSSTVLATLIVGNAYKDRIYAELAYNATRTARGDKGVYKIGSSKVPDGTGNYAPIADATASALNFKRIFVLCTENTASASELIINGLRGLDIDVHLIGTTTNGKNVGMEGYKDYEIKGAKYTFMPITFYSINEKGFKEYSDGFEPDVYFDDTYFPGDFGTTSDPLYSRAARWIRTGTKPESTAALQTRSSASMELLGDDMPQPPRHSRGSLVFRGE